MRSKSLAICSMDLNIIFRNTRHDNILVNCCFHTTIKNCCYSEKYLSKEIHISNTIDFYNDDTYKYDLFL